MLRMTRRADLVEPKLIAILSSTTSTCRLRAGKPRSQFGVRAEPSDQMATLRLQTFEDLAPCVVAIGHPVRHCWRSWLAAQHVDGLFEVEVHPRVRGGRLPCWHQQSQRGLSRVEDRRATVRDSRYPQKRDLQPALRSATRRAEKPVQTVRLGSAFRKQRTAEHADQSLAWVDSQMQHRKIESQPADCPRKVAPKRLFVSRRKPSQVGKGHPTATGKEDFQQFGDDPALPDARHRRPWRQLARHLQAGGDEIDQQASLHRERGIGRLGWLVPPIYGPVSFDARVCAASRIFFCISLRRICTYNL